MSTNVKRYVGVCCYKFTPNGSSFAKVSPLFSVQFKPARELAPLRREETITNFPNKGFIFWKPSPPVSPELDGIYEFGIEDSPEYHGSHDHNKEWFKVKAKDQIDELEIELIDLTRTIGFEAFRERMQFTCGWRCAKKLFIFIGEWVYGPYFVIDRNLNKTLYEIKVRPNNENEFRRFKQKDFFDHARILQVVYVRQHETNFREEVPINRSIIDVEPPIESGETCEFLSLQNLIVAIFEKLPASHRVLSNFDIEKTSEVLAETKRRYPPYGLYSERLQVAQEALENVQSLLLTEDKLLEKLLALPKIRAAFESQIQVSVKSLCAQEYAIVKQDNEAKLREHYSTIEQEWKVRETAARQVVENIEQEISAAQARLDEIKQGQKTYQSKLDETKAQIENYAPAAQEIAQNVAAARELLVKEFTAFQAFLQISDGAGKIKALEPPNNISDTITHPPEPDVQLRDEAQFVWRWYALAESEGLVETGDLTTIWAWHIATKAFPFLVVPGPEWLSCWLKAFGYSPLEFNRVVGAGWIDPSAWLACNKVESSHHSDVATPYHVLSEIFDDSSWRFSVIHLIDVNRSLPELYLLPVLKALRHHGVWEIQANHSLAPGKSNGEPSRLEEKPWLRWVFTKSPGSHAHQLTHEFWQYVAQLPVKSAQLEMTSIRPAQEDLGIVNRKSWQSWIKEPTEDDKRRINEVFKNAGKTLRDQDRFLPQILKDEVCKFLANARPIFSEKDALHLAISIRLNAWQNSLIGKQKNATE